MGRKKIMTHIQVFPFNPFSENTYVIYNDEKSAFIIDPGNFHPQETEHLFRFIDEQALQVQKILLTHAHIDHVLGLQKVYDAFQVPVHLHPLEQEILDRNPMDAHRFGFQFAPFSGEIVPIQEGDTLYLDHTPLDIFHIPGHSPGSVGYYCATDGFILSGDALFQGSIGRTDLYKGNHDELLHSIKTKLFTLPEETVVLSGHGNATHIGVEKNTNPFF